MQTRWLILLLSSWLFLPGCSVVQKASWIPPSILNEMIVRQMPAYNAIEAEITGSVEKGWNKGFRQDARYLSKIGSPLLYPVMIDLREWEAHDPSPTGTFYVQLILKDESNYGVPRDKGLSVVASSAKMVACYAWEGPYTYESFARALAKVRAELKRRDIPSSGPPRILLYRNPDWTLKRWCLAELQIPVPDKINPD